MNTNIWITSDTHYQHKNITGPSVSSWKSGYRNYSSIEEMNDDLVGKINSLVHEHDTLYHLGDWSFGGHQFVDEFRNRINCKNVHLILGNHDGHISGRNSVKRKLFSSVQDRFELMYHGYLFVMDHYPIDVWDKKHQGSYHLYGHVHGTLPDRGNRSMDVGVDTNDMKPYHIDEIIERLKNRPSSIVNREL